MEKKRILIADDDPVIQDVMKSALIPMNVETDTVSDGKAATESIEKIAYDLVITDYKMPKMDGLELIRWIKSTYPRIPVLLVTGAMPDDVAVQGDVAAFITKPFNISEFRKIVGRILQKNPREKKLSP